MFGLNKRRCFFNALDTLPFKECIILYILHCPVIYHDSSTFGFVEFEIVLEPFLVPAILGTFPEKILA